MKSSMYLQHPATSRIRISFVAVEQDHFAQKMRLAHLEQARWKKNAVGLGKNAVWPGKDTIFRTHFTKKCTIVSKKLAGNNKRRKDEKAILPENAEKKCNRSKLQV